MKNSAATRKIPTQRKDQLASRIRKKPQQARSRQMVQRILEAAGQVFLAKGYDRATTNQIAETAGISVGSLYQFFPNKAALLAELQQHWSEHLELELIKIFANPERSLDELVKDIIDLHLQLHQETNGLLDFLITANSGGSALGKMRQVVQKQLEKIAAWHNPEIDVEQCRLQAQVTIHIFNALYANSSNGAADPRLRSEVFKALVGYLRENGRLLSSI